MVPHVEMADPQLLVDQRDQRLDLGRRASGTLRSKAEAMCRLSRSCIQLNETW